MPANKQKPRDVFLTHKKHIPTSWNRNRTLLMRANVIMNA